MAVITGFAHVHGDELENHEIKGHFNACAHREQDSPSQQQGLVQGKLAGRSCGEGSLLGCQAAATECCGSQSL